MIAIAIGPVALIVWTVLTALAFLHLVASV